MDNKPDIPDMSDFDLEEVVGILFGIPPEKEPEKEEVESDTASSLPNESDLDK